MGRRRNPLKADTILQGVLLVDKPEGLTSHDVCQKVRYCLRLGKVGHGGTLDPFATGLLPLMLNGATRLMPYMQTQDKMYDAVVRLGVRTDTLDPTGTELERRDTRGLADAAIVQAVAGFAGKQTQTIPRYSAARIDGRHLYEYARAGEEVQQPEKDIEIFSIGAGPITRQDDGTVDVAMTVHCSVGTYVRALADDLGSRLGVGGHLLALRRTGAGALQVATAISLDRLVAESNTRRDGRNERSEGGETIPFSATDNARDWGSFLGDALLPVATVLGDVAVLGVSAALVPRVDSGNPVRKREVVGLEGFARLTFAAGDRIIFQHPDGLRSLALVRAQVGREALGRLPDDAVVFKVERVLR